MAQDQAFDTAALLRACNPWWQGGWQAAAAGPQAAQAARIHVSLHAEDAPRVLLLEGQRLTGKSTLLGALAEALVGAGVPPGRVCLVSLDSTPLRWQSAEAVIDAWQALQPGDAAVHWLLVDDLHLWTPAQRAALAVLTQRPDWRVIASGLPALAWRTESAEGLARATDAAGAERGAHATHTDQVRGPSGGEVAWLCLQTANFAQFLALRGVHHDLPPAPRSLRETFDWPRSQFHALAGSLRSLNAHFNDYLVLGGYLPALLAPTAGEAHARLRETVVRTAISVDAPAMHGVRRVDDLLLALHYLVARTGRLLDVPDLCTQLSVERPTVRHFLQLLEDLALVRRVPPLGYGDSVQRARFLICAQDPALPRALLRQERTDQLSDTELDGAVEIAIHRHLQGTYGSRGGLVSYAPLGRQGSTLVVAAGRTLLPFAQHYSVSKTGTRDLGGLIGFCQQHAIQRAYVATRLAEDCGPLLVAGGAAGVGSGDATSNGGLGLALMRLPAALLCLWLSAAEQPRFERR